ncbi:YcgN family cysteine cluster protein [Sneathiella litorea]|nr:YcgN family cysteine cluster protein [Sneathiella litorea]
MTAEQWESLCDGCGKCCLLKLEDADTLELSYTDVACRLLDLGSCRCAQYSDRSRLVPDCVTLTPEIIPNLRWMPKTCAYRLISENKPLPWWHPLVSNDPETVHQAGVSVRGRAISERRAGDLEDHIVDWPDEDVG